MKRLIAAVAVLCLLITPAWGKTTKQKPQKKARAAAEQKAPETQPPYRALLVVEARTGEVVAAEEPHLRWPPASITKLMVALLVLEKVQEGQVHLSDPVPVSPEAAKMGGSQVYLEPGETFPLEEMMQAVMVASANDAAYAVAESIAGSREAFVQMMNEKAQALGMNDTRFHSPHGLPPSEDQEPDLTSCNDLVILARELLRYPKILEWTAVQSAPFRNDTFVMTNHNRLLHRMTGMDGLKTGYYRESGYNIVATAERNGVRLIGVVLGSPKSRIRDRIVEEKLKAAFARYEMVTVVRKNQTMDKAITVKAGKQKTLQGVAADTFAFPVLREKKKELKVDIVVPEAVEAAVEKDQVLGEIVVRLGEREIGRVPVVSPVAIERKGFFARLFD